jgi:hypothetical protein
MQNFDGFEIAPAADYPIRLVKLGLTQLGDPIGSKDHDGTVGVLCQHGREPNRLRVSND